MEMPKPNASHQRLTALVGTWEGEERIHPGPFDPVGATAVSRVVNRLALDGFAVVQDYRQTRNGVANFQGHGVFRFAPEQGQYVLHWFDSWGQPPIEFLGGFEGQVLRLVQQGAQGWVRASWDLTAGTSYDYTMEVSGDGTQWMPFITGTMRRTAP